MHEKTNKISVLRKMIGLGEEIEPQFIVPQNSVSNLRAKLGLSERHMLPNAPSALLPAENSFRSVGGGLSQTITNSSSSNNKCPHCENMAKNFLYLESLIRSNYNSKYQCSLCYSSLKYLQYVNKSIMQVFGNFDSIVQAAKAFGAPQKHFKMNKQRSRISVGGRKSKVNASLHTAVGTAGGSKQRLAKKKSKAGGVKLSAQISKQSAKSVSRFSLKTAAGGGGDRAGKAGAKTRSKHSLKKAGAKSKANMSTHSVRTAEGGAFENGAKFIAKKKPAGGGVLKSSAHNKSRTKLRSALKGKRNKVSLMRVHG